MRSRTSASCAGTCSPSRTTSCSTTPTWRWPSSAARPRSASARSSTSRAGASARVPPRCPRSPGRHGHARHRRLRRLPRPAAPAGSPGGRGVARRQRFVDALERRDRARQRRARGPARPDRHQRAGHAGPSSGCCAPRRRAGGTGAAVTVRLDPAAPARRVGARRARRRRLPAGAGDLRQRRRVHRPRVPRRARRAGATLEWCFGNEAYYRDGYKDPTDAERLDGFARCSTRASRPLRARAARCGRRPSSAPTAAWATTTCSAASCPRSQARLSDVIIDAMLVANPARLLDH